MNLRLQNNEKPTLSLKRRKLNGTNKTAAETLRSQVLVPCIAPKLKRNTVSELQQNSEELLSKDVGNAGSCSEEVTQEHVEVEQAEGGSEEAGLGSLFFCHLCQKDLTKFTEARRQQHLNRCCDAESAKEKAVGGVNPEEEDDRTCVICQKMFKDSQARNAHMKACAKKNSVSTPELLEMVKGQKEAGCSSSKGAKKEGTVGLRAILRSSDGDFKKPPALKRRKRKKNNSEELQCLNEIECEQLQIALAMSASLEPPGSGEELPILPPSKGKKKRTRKQEPEVFPLLTVSTQQSRDLLARRAEKLLGGGADTASSGDEDEEISCTPAFGSSNLAGQQWGGAGKVVGRGREEEEEEVALNWESDKNPSDEEIDGTEALPESVTVDDKDESGPESGSEGGREGSKESKNEDEGSMDCQPSVSVDSLEALDPAHPMDPLKASFMEEFKGVAYPTLWQLGSGGLTLDVMGDYYVTSLNPLLSPSKKNPLSCEKCNSEACMVIFDPHLPGSSPKIHSDASEDVGKTPPNCAEQICDTDETTPHGLGDTRVQDGSIVTTREEATSSSLQSDLGAMVNSPLLSDVTILTGGGGGGGGGGSQLRAHACILAARCPGFKQAVLVEAATPIVLNFSTFPRHLVLLYLEKVYTGSMSCSQLDDHSNKELQAIDEKMSSVELISECIRHHHSAGSEDHLPVAVCDCTPPVGGKDNAAPTSCASPDNSPPPLPRPPLLGDGSPSLPQMVPTTPTGCALSELDSDTNSSPISVTRLDSPSGSVILESGGHRVTMDSPSGSVVLESGGYHVTMDSPSGSVMLESGGMESPSGSVILAGRSSRQSDSAPDDGDGPDDARVFNDDDDGIFDSILENISSSQLSPPASVSTTLPLPPNGPEGGATPLSISSSQPSPPASVSNTPPEGVATPLSISSSHPSSPATVSTTPPLPPNVPEGGATPVFDTPISIDADSLPTAKAKGGGTVPPPSPPPHLVDSNFTTSVLPPLPPPTVQRCGGGNAGTASADLTPATTGGGSILLSDDAITPTPNYHLMRTPMLKSQCARFGVKALPKRKMIAKLEEIYEYTHPLVGEDGTIVQRDHPATAAKPLPNPHKGKTQDLGSLQQQVKDIITSNTALYHDILLYKPLEIGQIQTVLKSGGLSIGKDKLLQILDFMCVTLTEQRNARQKATVS